MEKTNKVSHANFYRLLKLMPGVEKEQIVWEASGMLTGSLSELYEQRPEAYRKMIASMEKVIQKNTSPDEVLKRYRSAIQHRLQKHGINTANWTEVNAFMKQPRICGRMLWELNTDDLKALLPKLEAILAKDTEIKEELERLKQMN